MCLAGLLKKVDDTHLKHKELVNDAFTDVDSLLQKASEMVMLLYSKAAPGISSHQLI